MQQPQHLFKRICYVKTGNDYFNDGQNNILIEKIIRENTRPPIEKYRFKLWQLIASDNVYFPLLSHLTEALIEIIYINLKDKFFSDDLQAITNYINTNLDKDLSNNALAAQALYHKNHFISKFTKRYGLSPQKYVLKTRISEAIVMLMQDKKIQDISLNVGYKDPKSFSRAFRREVGISPFEYKNTHYYGLVAEDYKINI